MLIASLIREQRQQEDRAAHDAWANGGAFQGAPMTDARYVAYLKARRDSFTTDDPLWDQFNNQVIQTEFSVGEQKIGLAFKQGKVGAGAVAAFYRGQLSKIPKDSAFYRDVAGRAAEWAKSASASARASAGARARKAAEAQLDKIKATISSHDAITAAVEDAARRAGLITGNQNVFDADSSDLQDLIASGGTPVTLEAWQQATVAAYNAMGQALPVYKQLGWDTNGLQEDRRKFLDGYISQLNSLDDRAKYETARELWESRVEEAGGDPFLIEQYTRDYVRSLGGIYQKGLSGAGLDKNNSDFLSAVTNEIEALSTGKFSGPTPMDLISGGKQDGQSSADTRAALDADVELLNRGLAYYGQSTPGGGFEVIPFPANAALDPFGRNGLDPSVQQSVIRINGKPRVVYLKGQEIRSSVLRDPNGTAVSTEGLTNEQITQFIKQNYSLDPGGEVVGYTFINPNTRQPTYGVYDATGELRFTQDNPFLTSIYNDGRGNAVVIGAEAFNAEGKPIVAPGSALTTPVDEFSPLAVDSSVSPSDIRRMLSTAYLSGSPLGLSGDKAKEYDDWQRSRAQGTGQQQTQAQPQVRGTTPGGSAAQAAISAALANIQGGLASFLKPPGVMPPTPSPNLPPKQFPAGVMPPQTTPTTSPPGVLPPAPPPIKPPSLSPGSGAGSAAASSVNKILDKYLSNPPIQPVTSDTGSAGRTLRR